MKRVLIFFILFIIYHLSFIISVQAACVKNINLPASGDNLGCSSGSCTYDYFQPNAGKACSGADATSGKCFCYGGEPPPTAPPTNPPASGQPTATPTPTPSDYTPPPACVPSNPGDKDSQLSSRPIECENCNQTQSLTPSCATTFDANDEITFRSSRNDFSCQNQAWIKDSWKGTVTINLSDPKNPTKIPFVGKKGEESESKYLADYFEGTAHYEPVVDLEDCKTCQTSPTSASCTICRQKLKEVLNRGGVFPKLAPKEIQDDLKEKMINRAVKSLAGTAGYDQAIHDYLVSVKDGTQVLKAQLSEFIGHFPPKLKDFTSEINWKIAYNNWLNSNWGKLWSNVPMFSREDTSGYVTSYVGPRSEDVIGPQNPKQEIERVPHLARLNEVTEALQELLLPFQSSQQLLVENSQNTKTNVTALRNTVTEKAETDNNNNKVLGEQTPECFNLTPEISTSPATGGTRVCVTIKICSPEGGGDGHVMVWVDGKLTIANTPWRKSKEDPCFNVMPEWAGCFFVPNGGGVNLPNYSVTLDHCKNGIVRKDLASCGITADIKGKVNTTCAIVPPPPPPPPICGLPPAAGVPNCNKNNVVQSDDGDKLCCNQTSINISAVDTFVNPFYQNYLKTYDTCYDACLKEPGKTAFGCNNRCDPEKSVGVSRGVQISLRHPYLFKIWQQTNDSVSGLFNILRPEAMPKFNDNPASSVISYKYQPQKAPQINNASPQTGQFYFPFLGGIQQAKESILKLLNP